MTSSVCSNSTEELKAFNGGPNEEQSQTNLIEQVSNENEPISDEKSKQIDNDHDESNNPIEIFKKLEILKEIKLKSNELEKLKTKLVDEVDTIETENKSITTYQSELDALVKEKIEQMEILQQIQEDINVMESTIKQADEDKTRSIQNALQLHVDYEPLKEQVNHLRASIGLEKLNDTIDISVLENYLDKFNPFGSKQEKPRNESTPSFKSHEDGRFYERNHHQNSVSIHQPIAMPAFNPFTNFNHNISKRVQEYQMSPNVKVAKSPPRIAGPAQISSEEFNKHFNKFIVNQNKAGVANVPAVQANPMPHSFRQQPPPMKACLSCNQQIHRNAPICPLCKAKSRSRNPKKPKKKMEQSSSISPN
ncbi:zinc finger C4H2 domain-containing -like [Brachionus plicatilis]|uniref:Zinc finger C4H2 domain-containing-like n=1 Tax=Brachionus plicatilis TaxID=10195 RepID=A0A3M7R019_BRAPC|nr:zinc finger C4H2 domain-containing -like [Brachionus plicatilis]